MRNDQEVPHKTEFSEFSDTVKGIDTGFWSPEALKKLSDAWDKKVKFWTEEELKEARKGWEEFFKNQGK